MCSDNKQTSFLTCFLRFKKRLCCYISMVRLACVANFWNYRETPWSAIAVRKRKAHWTFSSLWYGLFHSVALVMSAFCNRGRPSIRSTPAAYSLGCECVWAKYWTPKCPKAFISVYVWEISMLHMLYKALHECLWMYKCGMEMLIIL